MARKVLFEQPMAQTAAAGAGLAPGRYRAREKLERLDCPASFALGHFFGRSPPRCRDGGLVRTLHNSFPTGTTISDWTRTITWHFSRALLQGARSRRQCPDRTARRTRSWWPRSKECESRTRQTSFKQARKQEASRQRVLLTEVAPGAGGAHQARDLGLFQGNQPIDHQAGQGGQLHRGQVAVRLRGSLFAPGRDDDDAKANAMLVPTAPAAAEENAD